MSEQGPGDYQISLVDDAGETPMGTAPDAFSATQIACAVYTAFQQANWANDRSVVVRSGGVDYASIGRQS